MKSKVAPPQNQERPIFTLTQADFDSKLLAVMLNKQGAAYLRVAENTFLQVIKKSVEAVTMDIAAIADLSPVKADVHEAAEMLLNPPEGTKVSAKARLLLEEIMKRKTASKGKKDAAPAKSVKAAKTNGTGDGFRAQKVVLSVKKMPKEGEAPTQAIAMLGILKEHGKLTPKELAEKMDGVIASKQPMLKVINLHRAKLFAAGFLSVAPAA